MPKVKVGIQAEGSKCESLNEYLRDREKGNFDDNDNYDDTNIAMIQVFHAASTKQEYLTNMAKQILAVEIQDYRGVRQFCTD